MEEKSAVSGTMRIRESGLNTAVCAARRIPE